jgi:hypothetical protein
MAMMRQDSSMEWMTRPQKNSKWTMVTMVHVSLCISNYTVYIPMICPFNHHFGSLRFEVEIYGPGILR